MKRYSEHRRLFFPAHVFDDILKGIPGVPLVGEPCYRDFINQVINAISESDVSILTELYPNIPESTWLYVCDYGRKNYFQGFVRQGDLCVQRVVGALVVLIWRVEDTRDIETELEDAITEALSAGKAGRDIVEMVKKIEWRLWHE